MYRPLVLSVMLFALVQFSVAAEVAPDPSDDAIMSRLIPAIVLEQAAEVSTVPEQGYRLRIFDDGRIYYDGIIAVKTLGMVESQIPESRVQYLKSKLRELKFWRLPENQLLDRNSPRETPADAFASLRLTLTVRDGADEKTIRFMSQAAGYAYQDLIEKETQSARWRCPFVDARFGDVCKLDDRFMPGALRKFYERELPKYQEIYR